MTTIIVKNANFAGNKLQFYEPPIADLTVCQWHGLDDGSYTRNFGSLTGATSIVGTPTKQSELYRRFDLNNYLILPTYRKPTTSIFAVFRDVGLPTAQTFAFACSSERDAMNGANYNGGRRGLSFMKGYAVNGSAAANYALYISAFGDSAGASFASQAIIANQNVSESLAMFGEVYNSPTTAGARVVMYRWTPVANTAGVITNSTVASTIDLTDESSYPLMVGRSYRTAYNQPIDMAFIAIGERLWTPTEKQALYDSVKRRFTALGGVM